MKVTKAAKYKYELKTYEYNKNEIVQWKNDKKKIGEESLIIWSG